jgi:DNA-binding FadR family transcriptional regulator
MTGKETAFFDVIRQTPNLRSELVDVLIAQIESGDLEPGQRLPTEQAIMEATGVSRTVVREALAALRAKGLITTRQGLGAFVSSDPAARSFSIVPHDMETIDEILSILELRLGIEVEAAGLAALRRTDEDLARMQQKLDALDAAILSGQPGGDQDFGFHRAILVATRNGHYARLFDTFGGIMLPRQWARFDRMSKVELHQHMARMKSEHMAILNAIRDGDEKGAQRAIRKHLSRSADRFRDLQKAVGRA